MNRSLIVCAFLASILAAGCSGAPKSHEVSAAYVSSVPYQGLTCAQLVTEAESIRRSVPGLAAAVDKHRSNQDGVEFVAAILFWPALFALDKGEATSNQLARAKGELEAVGTAMQAKRCGSSPSQTAFAPVPATNTPTQHPLEAVQPQVAVTMPTSFQASTPAAPRAPLGQDAYNAGKTAVAEACTQQPTPVLAAKGPGFESYTVACSNGDTLMLRCEFGNCRVLR